MSDNHWNYEEGTYTLQEICYTHPPPVIVNLSEDSDNKVEENLDLSNPLLIYRQRNINKVTAHNVQRELYMETGPPLLIPEDYKGWFAVLQKKQISPVTLRQDVMEFKLVSELSNSDTETFLIGGSEQVNALQMSISIDGKSHHQPRSIFPGEVLRKGKIYVGQTKRKSGFLRLKSKMKQEYYLLCTDDCEREILLPFHEKGVFYTLTTQSDRMKCPVMQMKDIIDKKILPATVKLLFGRIPSINCAFTSILRLDHSHFERSVIACTMSDRNGFMELALSSPLSFKIVDMNMDVIASEAYKKAYATCNEKAYFYMRGIKVCNNSGDIFSEELDEEIVPSVDILRKKKSVASSTGSSDDNRESGYIEMRDSLELSEESYVDMKQMSSNESTTDLDDMEYVLPTHDRSSRHDSLRRTRSSCRSPPPTCSPPPLPTTCQGPFNHRYVDSGISDPPMTTRSSARIDKVQSDKIYDIPKIPRRLSAPDTFNTYSLGIRKPNSLEILDESVKGDSIKYENFSILREVVPKKCGRKSLNRQKKLKEPIFDGIKNSNVDGYETVKFDLDDPEITVSQGDKVENQNEADKIHPDFHEQTNNMQTETVEKTSIKSFGCEKQAYSESDEQETQHADWPDEPTYSPCNANEQIKDGVTIETLVTYENLHKMINTDEEILQLHLTDDPEILNKGGAISAGTPYNRETNFHGECTSACLSLEPKELLSICECSQIKYNKGECNEDCEDQINNDKDSECKQSKTEHIMFHSQDNFVELEQNQSIVNNEKPTKNIFSDTKCSKDPFVKKGDIEDGVSGSDTSGFDHLYIEIIDTEISSIESTSTPPPTACTNRALFYHSPNINSYTGETNNENLGTIHSLDEHNVMSERAYTDKKVNYLSVGSVSCEEENKACPMEQECNANSIDDVNEADVIEAIEHSPNEEIETVDGGDINFKTDLYNVEEQSPRCSYNYTVSIAETIYTDSSDKNEDKTRETPYKNEGIIVSTEYITCSYISNNNEEQSEETIRVNNSDTKEGHTEETVCVNSSDINEEHVEKTISVNSIDKDGDYTEGTFSVNSSDKDGDHTEDTSCVNSNDKREEHSERTTFVKRSDKNEENTEETIYANSIKNQMKEHPDGNHDSIAKGNTYNDNDIMILEYELGYETMTNKERSTKPEEMSETKSSYVSESTQTDNPNNRGVTESSSLDNNQQLIHDYDMKSDTSDNISIDDGNIRRAETISHKLDSGLGKFRSKEETGSVHADDDDNLSRLTAIEIVSGFKKLGIKRNVTDIVKHQNLKGSDLKDLHKLTQIFPGISCVDRRKISMFLQGMMQSDSRADNHDDLQPVWV